MNIEVWGRQTQNKKGLGSLTEDLYGMTDQLDQLLGSKSNINIDIDISILFFGEERGHGKEGCHAVCRR